MPTITGRRTALKAGCAALLAGVARLGGAAPQSEPGAPGATRTVTLGYVDTPFQAGIPTLTSSGASAGTSSLSAALQNAAARHHVTLCRVDGGADLDSQVRALRSLLARKVDVIALAPLAERGYEPALREAKAAGIPVIVTGHALAAGAADLYVSLLGPDYTEEGRRAVAWLAGRAARTPRGAPGVVELLGIPTAASIARSQGAAQAAAGLPGLALRRVPAGSGDRLQGRQAVASLLRTQPGIQALLVHGDDLALGAIEAIEQAGLVPGRDIDILSLGGGAAALQAVAAGKLSATVECAPLPVQQLMQLVRDVAAGRTVPRWVATTGRLVTAEALAAKP